MRAHGTIDGGARPQRKTLILYTHMSRSIKIRVCDTVRRNERAGARLRWMVEVFDVACTEN